MQTIAIILFNLLITWNWGGISPQFHFKSSSVSSDKYIAQINLLQKHDKLLEVESSFYNGCDQKMDIDYNLLVRKSGQSSSSSNQSGNFSVKSRMQIVLSKIIVNLNKDDLYKIKLEVFNNNQLIAEDSASFYGDKIIQN